MTLEEQDHRNRPEPEEAARERHVAEDREADRAPADDIERLTSAVRREQAAREDWR